MKNNAVIFTIVLTTCFISGYGQNYVIEDSYGINANYKNIYNAYNIWISGWGEKQGVQWGQDMHVSVFTPERGGYDAFNFRSRAISPFVFSGANVGIGTISPSEKLEVNGAIRSKEVRVEASPWPDYVFEDDYRLKELAEVAQFIKENGHLPNIPSEKEVSEQGLALGYMNAKLLEKVEELTLYLIEKDEEIRQLKECNRLILERLKKLED